MSDPMKPDAGQPPATPQAPLSTQQHAVLEQHARAKLEHYGIEAKLTVFTF